MSNLTAIYGQIKNDGMQQRFETNAAGTAVIYEKECLFARQQLAKNDYTLKAAVNNPEALQGAILNVAAIGISLNPATAHAYLVPRGGVICLDISYRGLIKLATDSGAIKWAKAELVYTNDQFEWNGPCTEPTHKADPFSTDRGDVKGAYCIAKLPDDSVLVEVMSLADIKKVQATSKAGSGPWVTWWDEMAKKTIIKRASKTWPQTENTQRFSKAVDVLNEHEGSAYTFEQQADFMKAVRDGDGISLIKMQRELPEETLNALFNSFPKGEKTKNKERVRQLQHEAHQQLQDAESSLIAYADSEDKTGVLEILEEIPLEMLDVPAQYLPFIENVIRES